MMIGVPLAAAGDLSQHPKQFPMYPDFLYRSPGRCVFLLGVRGSCVLLYLYHDEKRKWWDVDSLRSMDDGALAPRGN
jgi:hypothetical protein